MSDNQVQVIEKNVYGQERWYPANARAEAICALTGYITIRPDDIRAIEALGFELWRCLEDEEGEPCPAKRITLTY